jgi:hypothetical protein
MSEGRDGGDAGSGAVALIASSLLLHDLPDSSAEERAAAGRHVEASVAAMPGVTRLGARVAGAAAYGALSVIARRRYRALPERRRAELAARLVDVPLPVIGELGRLTRGLGLVAVHERRHAAARAATAHDPPPAR